jgi:bacillithiol system protein YtxJ
MNQQSSALANGFVELSDMESLDRFLAESNGSAALVFKHSNLCGISARAYAEMSRINVPIGLIIVQQARDVSNEIETRTGVAHETPQVFIIRDRQVLWTASHGQIKAEAIEAALLEISGQNRNGVV